VCISWTIKCLITVFSLSDYYIKLILPFWFSVCLVISITDIIENIERREVHPIHLLKYVGADKSLARPRRKQATGTKL